MAEALKNRTKITEALEKIGEKVHVYGWVQTVRAHGKIAFFDIRDRSGLLQVGGFTPELAHKIASFGSQDVVIVSGTVKKRDERYINASLPTGSIELEAEEIQVLQKSKEMPFDMGGKELHLELPTLLDYRSLTLKHEKVRQIFIIQAALAEAFRELAKELECVEIFVPTIAAGATEGGAEVFPIDYYGWKAFLTQSS